MGSQAQNEVAIVLTPMLEKLPKVKTGTHLHNANFLVGKKVFAFVKGDAVALKLPPAKIKELAGDNDIAPLVMGKRTMKEWVTIKRKKAAEYKRDILLFKASIDFVSSL